MNQGSQFRDWNFTDAPLVGMADGNLLSDGSDFSQSSWAKTNVTLAIVQQALPDGTTGTVSVMYGNGATPLEHYVEQDVTIAAGATIRFQGYFKPLLTSGRGRIAFGDATFAVTAFKVRFDADLNGGDGGFTTDTFVGSPRSFSATISPVPGTPWYFVQLDMILDDTTTAARLRIQLVDASGNTSYTGVNGTITAWTQLSLNAL